MGAAAEVPKTFGPGKLAGASLGPRKTNVRKRASNKTQRDIRYTDFRVYYLEKRLIHNILILAQKHLVANIVQGVSNPQNFPSCES